MNISNTQVYGLQNAMEVSGYPMVADLSNWDERPSKTLKRAENLASTKTGEGHDNFLNGIVVQFDLCVSIQCWQELQRYHFIDFISSQSKMHRIHKMNIKECCNQYVDDNILAILDKKVQHYNEVLKSNETSSDEKQQAFLHLIYNVPSGFEYTAGMTTNYRQLKTIYLQRRNHRLPEWHMICDWIEQLPFSHLITGGRKRG